MCFLSNLRRGSLARAYGPHGFVCDDHLGPVFDRVLNCIKLHLENVMSVPRLPFLQLLTHAEYRCDPLVLTSLQFLRYNLVSLEKVLASLAVTHEGPVHTEVFNLLSFYFSSLSSLVGRCDILDTHVNV